MDNTASHGTCTYYLKLRIPHVIVQVFYTLGISAMTVLRALYAQSLISRQVVRNGIRTNVFVVPGELVVLGGQGKMRHGLGEERCDVHQLLPTSPVQAA